MEKQMNLDLVLTALRDYRRWFEDDEEEARMIEEQIEIIEAESQEDLGLLEPG